MNSHHEPTLNNGKRVRLTSNPANHSEQPVRFCHLEYTSAQLLLLENQRNPGVSSNIYFFVSLMFCGYSLNIYTGAHRRGHLWTTKIHLAWKHCICKPFLSKILLVFSNIRFHIRLKVSTTILHMTGKNRLQKH